MKKKLLSLICAVTMVLNPLAVFAEDFVEEPTEVIEETVETDNEEPKETVEEEEASVEEETDVTSDEQKDELGPAVDAEKEATPVVKEEKSCEHTDSDEDSNCDLCGESISVSKDETNEDCIHVDEDEDGLCDLCGEEIAPKKEEKEHIHSYIYTSNGDSTHTVTCEGDDVLENCDYEVVDDCTFKDGVCKNCGYEDPDFVKLVTKDLQVELEGYTIKAVGEMPEGTNLYAKIIENESAEEDVNEVLEDATFEATVTFDIKLMYDGKEYQPVNFDEEITITITGVESEKEYDVYRITEDDEITKMETSNSGETVSFETDHFTTYTVGDVEYNSTKDGQWCGFDYSKYDTNGDGADDTVVFTGEQTSVMSYSTTSNSPFKRPGPYNYHIVFKDAKIKYGQGLCGDNIVRSVTFDNVDTSEMTNASKMFYGLGTKSINGFSELDTSNVTNMSYMFYGVYQLPDLSTMNTSAATDMRGMFSSCKISSETLDLSHFDTSKVTDMSCMFDGLTGKTGGNISINTTGWNTSKVTDMSCMFAINSTETIDLSHFDFSSVTEMDGMFSNCTKLEAVIMDNNYVATKLTNTSNMFRNCFNLKTFKNGHTLPVITLAQVTNAENMFNSCENIESFVNAGGAEISKLMFATNTITNAEGMFSNCRALNVLDLENFSVSSTEPSNCKGMLASCTSLTELNLSSFNAAQVTNAESMFNCCENLEEIIYDKSIFTFDNCTDFSNMFMQCHKLAVIDVSNFNTSKAEYMNSMFGNCTLLETLDISNFDFSNAKNISYIFGGCDNLKTIEIGDNPIDTSNVTDFNRMFAGCKVLTSFPIDKLEVTDKATDVEAMFANCALTEIPVTHFDVSNCTSLYAMFSNVTLSAIDLTGWDTSKVTDMSAMFESAKNLTQIIGIEALDVSKVENMSRMFNGCSKLTTLDLSSWNADSVEYINGMFADCTKLSSLDVTNLAVNGKVIRAQNVFYHLNSLTELDLSTWDLSKLSGSSSYSNIFGNDTLGSDYRYFALQKLVTPAKSPIQYNVALPETGYSYSDKTSSYFYEEGSTEPAYNPTGGTQEIPYSTEGSKTLYRKNSYSITFDSNEGTFETGDNYGINLYVFDGTTIADSSLPAISRDGYEFIGWYTKWKNDEQTAATKFDINTPITKDNHPHYLYAGWYKNHTAGTPVKENEVAATCTTAGSYDLVTYCTDDGCGAELSREHIVVEALGHTSGTAVEENRVNATCTKTGHYDSVVYCSRCNAELTRNTNTIQALGHNYSDSVEEERVEATCTTDGSYKEVKYCSRDNHRLVVNTHTIPATGHTPKTAVEKNRVNPTHFADGHYDSVVYCDTCGAELSRKTITLTKGNHNPKAAVVENNVDPTCTADGHYDSVVYCADDNAELSRETITVKKLGHLNGTPVIENNVDSTCEDEGSYDEVVYCSVCGDEISRIHKTVAANGHISSGVVTEKHVDATCTVDGHEDKVTYCNVCGDELTRETITIKKHGHNPGEEVTENKVAATCTEAGSYEEVTYCKFCDTELTREAKTVEALGHKDVEVKKEHIVEATYTEVGSYEEVKYCKECGIELSRETKVIPKKEKSVEKIPTINDTSKPVSPKEEVSVEKVDIIPNTPEKEIEYKPVIDLGSTVVKQPVEKKKAEAKPIVIKGRVVDDEGVAITNATVTVSTITGVEYTTVQTDSKGYYEFEVAKIESFTISATYSGYNDNSIVYSAVVTDEQLQDAEDIILTLKDVDTPTAVSDEGEADEVLVEKSNELPTWFFMILVLILLILAVVIYKKYRNLKES